MNSLYFKLEEFQCKCGECAMGEPSPDLVARLDALRDMLRRPVIINSGIRCQKANRKVGGVSSSAHLTGEAADLACATSRERWLMVNAALKCGFRRLGMGKTFVHVDVSQDLNPDVIWAYYS